LARRAAGWAADKVLNTVGDVAGPVAGNLYNNFHDFWGLKDWGFPTYNSTGTFGPGRYSKNYSVSTSRRNFGSSPVASSKGYLKSFTRSSRSSRFRPYYRSFYRRFPNRFRHYSRRYKRYHYYY